jgi:hypothetical protein
LALKPRGRDPGRIDRERSSPREFVVYAEANDVLFEADVAHDRRRETGVEAAEVDVEIFKLGCPAAEEGVFQPGAVVNDLLRAR